MKKLFIILGVLIIASVAFVMKDYIVPVKVNYKVTIEINTPDGLKTGSTIRQVQISKNITKFFNPDVKQLSYRTYGEAVFIDLENKGKLFYLINGYFSELSSFLTNKGIIIPKEVLSYYKTLEKGQSQLSDGWISFVYLSGAEEGMSRLDSKDFNRILGNGYSLASKRIEITDDTVTYNLESVVNKLNFTNNGYSRQDYTLKK